MASGPNGVNAQKRVEEEHRKGAASASNRDLLQEERSVM